MSRTFPPMARHLLVPDPKEGIGVCDRALFGTIRVTDSKAAKLAEIIIDGINNLPSQKFGQVARVECIWAPHPRPPYEYRGMIIFTAGSSEQQPIVHFADALMGYSGNGDWLGRHILRACGIPESLITEAEDKVEHKSYCLVFSREMTIVERGAYVVDSYADVTPHWRLAFKEVGSRERSLA